MSDFQHSSDLSHLDVNSFFRLEPNPQNWLPTFFFKHRNERQSHSFNFEFEYRSSLRTIAGSTMVALEQRSIAAWLYSNVTRNHFLGVFAAFEPDASEITQGDATIGLLHENPVIPSFRHRGQ
ncbi:hypothetical protein BGZ82_010249 [Podila clonocystis]|nr:hypothetical protein BGZ82_010249 [Podila clonocystis]